MTVGYNVHSIHPRETVASYNAHIGGEIKNRKYDKVCFTLPRGSSALPAGKASQCYKTLSSWFRTAAAVGVAATMFGPRGRNWQDESLQQLLTDNVAHESLHRLCRRGIQIENNSSHPSNATYTIFSTHRIDSSTCKCSPETVHDEDRKGSLNTEKKEEKKRAHANGKPYQLQHFLTAEAALLKALMCIPIEENSTGWNGAVNVQSAGLSELSPSSGLCVVRGSVYTPR